jgi:hypothetical protein
MQRKSIRSAFKKGFALCSPDHAVQGDSFRETEAEAVASRFKSKRTRQDAWAKAQANGWSVQLVYVRIFVPVFFSSGSKEMGEAV